MPCPLRPLQGWSAGHPSLWTHAVLPAALLPESENGELNSPSRGGAVNEAAGLCCQLDGNLYLLST